ncbi:hypothetical protein O181_040693 [Austropuccinia psidii MF-1]|uniref:Tc1-like transposase DDE domain-containing protein n=1 Tax=Austropuccinia psidii MF-1 TaxID=1389203 RepID=A0A9Q3HD41_9BASI|nr:hypothetical protein [Austropuccinia psidii MF-1]
MAVNHQSGCQSMMVWGDICGPIQSELIILPPGQRQAIEFIKNVYEPGLFPFMDKLVEVGVAEDQEGLTLMEDGAPIHTARVSQQWSNEHQIHKLNWPLNSPDLNLIDNLWFTRKHIVTHLFNPKTMEELTDGFHAVLEDISFDHLKALLQSFPKRMQMVVDQNGAPTHW